MLFPCVKLQSVLLLFLSVLIILFLFFFFTLWACSSHSPWNETWMCVGYSMNRHALTSTIICPQPRQPLIGVFFPSCYVTVKILYVFFFSALSPRYQGQGSRFLGNFVGERLASPRGAHTGSDRPGRSQHSQAVTLWIIQPKMIAFFFFYSTTQMGWWRLMFCHTGGLHLIKSF